MPITEEMIQNRIEELEHARDRLIEQANRELAALNARIDELRHLQPTEPPEQPES